MKNLKLIMLLCIGALFSASASYGQANPFISVLPSNSGIVAVGGTIDIIVTIGNSGPFTGVPQAKLRPIIQVPPSCTFLSTALQTGLPVGWMILTNTGSQIRICDSTDPIAVSTSRTIILKAQGVTVTPPQTFSANINFGNGTTCASGTTVLGDLTTDNSATSTIEVVAPMATVVATGVPNGCNGQQAAQINATATNITGALTWSLNPAVGVNNNDGTFESLAAGTYTVSVTNGTASTSTVVTLVDPIALSNAMLFTSPLCNNGTNGSITITSIGGTPFSGAPGPYIVELWQGTSASGSQLTDIASTGVATFSSLSAGQYFVRVEDSNACLDTVINITLANPTVVSFTVGTTQINCTNTTSTATLVGAGGSGAFTYLQGTATVTSPVTGLATGTYVFTATDANGCSATTSVVVDSIPDTTPPTIYLQPSSLLPGVTGPSTTQTPYLLSQSKGGKFTSILSVNDVVGSYRMVGIPDGLGAYDNNNGTFTLLMNHELGATSGIVRAHGSTGAFVSKWVINKSNLAVQSGSDLVQTVYTWNSMSNSFVAGTTQFNRFCSADLSPVAAFYNQATGLGTKERLFVTGEESGAEGRAFGHILTGANAGVSYQLPYLGRFSWENVVASPATGNKTVVAGTDDASTNGQVYFYIGTKTNSGTEIDKAGLNNGKLFGVKVASLPSELSTGIPAVNTPFTLEDLGFVQNTTGAALNTNSIAAGVTNFLRPEDGSFDPSNPNDFYFVTTNSFSAPSRMWRLRFNDIANPETGGTITAVLDGTEGQKMLDNMTIDKFGHVLLQEDPGGQAHNAKIWQYTIATDSLELVGKHDPARFGDLVGVTTTPATLPFNNDEESSGIIDMSDILGPGMFLLDDQAHYTSGLANLTEVVQGGQLLAFFNPASVGASALTAAPDTITSCSATGITLGTPATADNCTVASVTNNAPSTFPVGATAVTWTVTDASGNTSTATQTVIVSDFAASSIVGTIACFGGTTSVTVSATGGTTPYTGTGIFTVGAGAYTYTVTDSTGCVSTVSGSVTAPAAIATLVNVTQFGSYVIPGSTTTITASGITNQIYTAGNTCDSTVTYDITINNGVVVCAKVFLSGAYNVGTGLMRDSLRQKMLLPLSTPYGSGTYTLGYSSVNNSSSETTSASVLAVSGSNAIVDWVFVQLRSKTDSSIVLATRSALVQCDGDVVDMDGISPLTFATTIPDNYFVSIKHRNHVGIMTAAKFALSLTANCIDFTATSTPLFARAGVTGNPAPLSGATRTQGGVRTLYAGNCNVLSSFASRSISYSALTSSDRQGLLSATGGTNTINGYTIYDVDMNGLARFNGLNPDRLVILNNCAGSNVTITYEQTPN